MAEVRRRAALLIAVVCLLAGLARAESGASRNDSTEHRPTPRPSESHRATTAPTPSRTPEEGARRGGKSLRGGDKGGEGTIRRLFESLDSSQNRGKRAAPARPRGDEAPRD
jgi:hypothetical protein